jgi:hypothetical protein
MRIKLPLEWGYVNFRSWDKGTREISPWDKGTREISPWDQGTRKFQYETKEHVKFQSETKEWVKIHSWDQGVGEDPLLRPRITWNVTLRPRSEWRFTLETRNTWNFSLRQRSEWRFTLETKEWVKFHSWDKGVSEDSLLIPRSEWRFTLDIKEWVKIHSWYQGVSEDSLLRPRSEWRFTLRPRNTWNFTLSPRNTWNFSLKPRNTWNFTLRPTSRFRNAAVRRKLIAAYDGHKPDFLPVEPNERQGICHRKFHPMLGLRSARQQRGRSIPVMAFHLHYHNRTGVGFLPKLNSVCYVPTQAYMWSVWTPNCACLVAAIVITRKVNIHFAVSPYFSLITSIRVPYFAKLC